MKIAKYIQKVAVGDRSGLRLSHGPEWARDVLRLHETMRDSTASRRRESSDNTDLDLNESDDGEEGQSESISATIAWCGLRVNRILSADECNEMKKKGGI